MAEHSIKTITCPLCGNEEEHDEFFQPYESRLMGQLERAWGQKVNPDAFHDLCSGCQDQMIYLASENLLDSEKQRYLRGGTDGETQAEI